MKPLIVLLVTFLLSLIATRLIQGQWNYIFSGNLAMSAMLVLTAVGHFIFPKGMAMMIPSVFPFKTLLVYFTGVLEFAAAIGLMIISARHITGLLLIIFFIVILPANINAAIYKVDLEKATFTGNGLKHLWFRIPLQILFIGWVWYFCL